jgi:hypothetical protein
MPRTEPVDTAPPSTDPVDSAPPITKDDHVDALTPSTKSLDSALPSTNKPGVNNATPQTEPEDKAPPSTKDDYVDDLTQSTEPINTAPPSTDVDNATPQTKPVDTTPPSTKHVDTSTQSPTPYDDIGAESFLPRQSPKNDPSTVRAKAMEMKNRRQEENAIKAMKMCGDNAMADGAAVGAVVSLKVDYRTHSHANGLLGVVYAVNEGTGGILVCCEHGVITHSGTVSDYWVPYDKNRIVAKKDDIIPLTTAIEDVRNMVLAGKYDANAQS